MVGGWWRGNKGIAQEKYKQPLNKKRLKRKIEKSTENSMGRYKIEKEKLPKQLRQKFPKKRSRKYKHWRSDTFKVRVDC